MQRLWDKWGLPLLFIVIGGVILYALIFAPRRA